ncbi:MAG: RraA family protein [Opitutaceae bacterium]
MKSPDLSPSPPEIPPAAYAAVFADVLDSLGFRHQTLGRPIHPLTGATRIAGRVYPARAMTVSECPREPYALEIAAVEAMKSGDVLVIDAQDDQTCGFWGELLTTACRHKGVAGVVMTACTRDAWKLKAMDFPVFGLGYHPADSKGRAEVIAIGEPIAIAGVRAKTGDLILGDEDGIVIIPSEVAGEALRLAAAKMSEENAVRAALVGGLPIGEAFRRFGVL